MGLSGLQEGFAWLMQPNDRPPAAPYGQPPYSQQPYSPMRQQPLQRGGGSWWEDRDVQANLLAAALVVTPIAYYNVPAPAQNVVEQSGAAVTQAAVNGAKATASVVIPVAKQVGENVKGAVVNEVVPAMTKGATSAADTLARDVGQLGSKVKELSLIHI